MISPRNKGETCSRRQRSEDRRQRTEDRGHRTEDRRQKTEVRGQKTEDRGQMTKEPAVLLPFHGVVSVGVFLIRATNRAVIKVNPAAAAKAAK